MYIGTDFNEKTNIARVIDKLDFTFAISSMSIPYGKQYGISYINSYSPDSLRVTISDAVSRLREPNLNVNAVVVNHNNRTLNLELNYNGQAVTSVVTDNTTGD